MHKTIKELTILALFVLITTFLIWLPFLLKIHSFFNLDFSAGFNTIYRNFDGIEYLTIAKTFYSPSALAAVPQNNVPIYYASHFPLYPAFILLFSFLGFLHSMIFVTVLFTVLSVCMFYLLVKDFKLSDQPLFLSIIFTILPGRWVIVHSVGSPEPIFIFFILACFYLFMKFEQSKKSLFLWVAAVAAMLAQFTRPPGLLLFIAIALYIHWRYLIMEKGVSLFQKIKLHLKYYPFLLIPVGLLAIFYLYSQTLGDFFAYFHSGDNIHLTLPPFQIFNKNQYWVGDIWLEDILYIFIVGFSAGLVLLKKKLYPMAFFVLTYLAASTLIAHRDISRYTLPVMPFVIIAFENFLTSKEFKIVLIIVGLGIYLYSQNFIINNVAPIPNLSLFN